MPPGPVTGGAGAGVVPGVEVAGVLAGVDVGGDAAGAAGAGAATSASPATNAMRSGTRHRVTMFAHTPAAPPIGTSPIDLVT